MGRGRAWLRRSGAASSSTEWKISCAASPSRPPPPHEMKDPLPPRSGQAPLLLFLDDLQFVDEASLEVLYRLLDQEEGKVIVYAAAQSEALARQEGGPLPLARLFALLRQSQNFLRVGLGSLSLTSVTEMVTEILQRPTASPPLFREGDRDSAAPPRVPRLLPAALRSQRRDPAVRGGNAQGAHHQGPAQDHGRDVEPRRRPARRGAGLPGGGGP